MHQQIVYAYLSSVKAHQCSNAYKARMGWEIEWVSSDDAFDHDFYEMMHVPTPRRPGHMLDVMD